MGKVLSPIAGVLGMGSDQKPSFIAQNGNSALSSLQNRNTVSNDQNVNNAMRDYSSGKTGSYNDALASTSGLGFNPEQQNEVANQMAINPLTGSKMATEQVQNNGIQGQLYGKGGTLDRTNQEEQNLATQGFQLQPQDHEAYGQASGNVARMFGQQDDANMQNLASRGLASAGSGTAGAMFSGAQGNKSEMLSKAQMDIANQRMQNTTARLGQTRNFLNQMSQGANTAINEQYGRNQSGVNSMNQNLQQTAGTQNNANAQANKSNQEQMVDQRGAHVNNIGDALGNGLFSSAGMSPASFFGQQAGGGTKADTSPGGSPKPSGSSSPASMFSSMGATA